VVGGGLDMACVTVSLHGGGVGDFFDVWSTIWQVGAKMASEQLDAPAITREQRWSIFVEEKPPESLADLSPEARKTLLIKVTRIYHKLAKLVHPDKLGPRASSRRGMPQFGFPCCRRYRVSSATMTPEYSGKERVVCLLGKGRVV
jgi:hypothetical protein